MKKFDLDTPAVVIDSVALHRNIHGMQKLAEGLGVRLRPHTKTHKSPRIAHMQVEAGASGIAVAKVGEAEVMAEAGFDDIVIANQVVGPEKMRRLVVLAMRVRLAVLVDSREGVAMLERAFGQAGETLDVMIEVDTGKGRCGLTDIDEIIALAETIGGTAHLHLRGLETHEGHVPRGVTSARDMEERALTAGRRMVEVAEELRSRGHEIEEISVGSTPAAPYTASVSGITEMRPGTYIFNDVNQMAIDQASPDDCAFSILTAVISRPTSDRAVLDAGSKSLFSERARANFALEGYDGFGYIRGAPEAQIIFVNEEHGVVQIPEGIEFPAVGGLVEVIPNHVCPTVNLHDEFCVVEGDDVVQIWPIAARGMIR